MRADLARVLIAVAIGPAIGCDAGPDLPEAWQGIEPGTTELGDTAPCTAEPERLPDRLSEHACFDGTPPRPTAGALPYRVNAPLWSDGLAKDRWIALPPGASLSPGTGGALELPVGAVAIKEFREGERRIETRVLTRVAPDRWAATTYVWDEDGADARRAPDGAEIDIASGPWLVPSDEQCFECHVDAAGVSLGLSLAQLNGELDYGHGPANQLATLAYLGLLDVTDLGGPDDLAQFPRPGDESADTPSRARAYLHANCAHCHRPGADGGGGIDLRAAPPVSLLGLCGERPTEADPFGGDGALLVPGEPERSIVAYRVSSEDPVWRMPALGTLRVDDIGAQLVNDWIGGLDSCD